jgi:hypothetical protein
MPLVGAGCLAAVAIVIWWGSDVAAGGVSSDPAGVAARGDVVSQAADVGYGEVREHRGYRGAGNFSQ